MKVDMSPAAVRQRIELVNDLWQLSVKLMRSQKIQNSNKAVKRSGEKNYPITPAVRFLRQNNVDFVPHLYDYVEKGGTAESARQLGVEEHAVIKTLVFETNERKPLIVLMHGDRQVSTKNLARHIGVKSVEAATPDRASKWTGYLVGGTSPFGVKTQMPVYVEKTIFDLERIYINGGKRGFLVEIEPRTLNGLQQVDEVAVGIED